MKTQNILKTVKAKYPQLSKLSTKNRQIVEAAIVFAQSLSAEDEFLSDDEQRKLFKELGIGKSTPGSRLRAYRNREGLTQKVLADKTGVSQSNISAMEKGARPIGLHSAKILAKTLNCDYRKLV